MANDARPRVKLNIGAGPNPLPGWINTDLYARPDVMSMDATKRFPFDDEIFSHIWTEHMIEHVPQRAGEFMLCECFRVMRPGGRIRVATPDMRFLIGLTHPVLFPLQREYIAWSCHLFAPEKPVCGETVMEFFRHSWGHQFIYTAGSLWAAMEAAGFVDPVRCELQDSSDPELRNLANDTRMPPRFLALETMTIEAVKP
jgi:predicted SAM-dependent methyltransferase